MKRDLSRIFLLFSAFICGITVLPVIARADITVLSSGPGGLALSYRPDGIRADTLSANGKVYVRFSFDCHVSMGKPGEPSLPSRTVLFAAPSGSVPAIALDGLSRSLRSDVTVAPHPHLGSDLSGFTREILIEDPVRYAMSGFQPEDFIALGGRFDFDGVSVWELTFTPVLFDARARTAAIADSFRVTVSWSGNLGRTVRMSRIPDSVINREIISDTSLQKPAAPGGETVNPFATGDWYRVAVADSGMYSIGGAELAAVGFPVGSMAVSDIRMYYGGGLMLDIEPYEPSTDSFREIGGWGQDVHGDGVFGSEDSIIFYGEALSRFIALPDTEAVVFQNHPYSSTNIYWITISKNGPPRRIEASFTQPSDALLSRTIYREILHLERESLLEYPESGIEWYWDVIVGTTSKYFSFGAPGSVPGDSVVVRAAFLNPPFKKDIYTEVTFEHYLEIYVNESGPFSFHIPQIETGRVEMRFPGSFTEKNNLLKIRRLNGSPNELIQLDWYEIEYDRRLEFSEKSLEFFVRGAGEPIKLTVGNVPKASLQLFDTTDPYRVVELTGAVYDNQNRTLTFQVTPPPGRYSRFTLYNPSAYRKAVSIARKNRSDLRNPRNGADYIAITHRTFLEEAKKLAEWRARDSVIEPLKSMVVDVADIYDEFAWGVFDPVAIRDFLKYARENYHPGVRYCCLIGDTTYKYKNINPGQKSRNLVPTFIYKTIATDDFFTWNDPTNSPTISIGRFCVNTVEEARIVVDKTIEYERNPEKGMWHNRVLLIADDEKNENQIGRETDFSNNIEDFDRQNYIPKWIERVKIMEIEYPMKNFTKPDATEALLAAFNEGAVLANYVGHGNKDLLAHEHILVGPRDIERFNNGGRQSVFIIASCSVGEFDRIDYLSLAEILHLRKGGGCIAVIAPTRETFNSTNMDMNRAFYINLFNPKKNPECRIGLAMKLAKTNTQRMEIDFSSNRYIIFGDPATRLMVPRYGFAVSPVDTLRRLQKIDLTGSVRDSDEGIPYTGTLTVTAQGPMLHKKYIVAAGVDISYTMPGKTFFRGEIPITGEGFRISFVIPKDLTPVTNDSRVFLFAAGEGKEASGIIDNLPVGGVDPAAPNDIAGPEIKLSFDGKSFESGDYIKRQPTLTATLTDPFGINIYGNRGHNVTVTLDRTDVTVLTDKVACIGNYSNGVFAHAFPILTPGEHTLDVSAYDSYNNVTKKEVTLNVVGSETGDVAIQNLLNYPNPMRSSGTTFTFSLTDDAGSANIKIYSLSGRLVDTIRLSAGYGFNQVPWKPPFELANGVYFYKLTVRSLNGRKASKIEKLAVMR